MGVEVAPAQLPHPRLRPAAAALAGALLALARRQAAPAQVRRQDARAARGDVVAARVVLDRPGEEGRQRAARRLLARLDDRVAHVGAEPEPVERRAAARRRAPPAAPAWRAAHAPRRGGRRWPTRARTARTRGTASRPSCAAGRRRRSSCRSTGGPRRPPRAAPPSRAASRRRAYGDDVARPVHGARAPHSRGERGDLVLRPPVAHARAPLPRSRSAASSSRRQPSMNAARAPEA